MKLILIVLLCLIPFNVAQAASQMRTHTTEMPSSGLNYTAANQHDKEENKKKHLHIKQIAPIPDLEKKEKPQSEEAPFDRIWKKYKGLAAGEETPAPAAAATEATPAAEPAKTAEQLENAPPVGLEGILSNYYKNKEKRGQMKTRQVAKPDSQAPPQDAAQTPAAEEKSAAN